MEHPTRKSSSKELWVKAREIMGELVGPKSSPSSGTLGRLPRFVAENLLAMHGPAEAARIVADHFPGPDRVEFLRHTLVHLGRVQILDHLSVRVHLEQGRAFARLAAFGVTRAEIAPHLLSQYPELLGAGLWGRVDLAFRTARSRLQTAVVVSDFHPVSTQVRLDQFIGFRKSFGLDEWIDLWLYALGFHPDILAADHHDPARVKLLVLCRLIPLVEPRYHLIELGPKNTGKTFLFRNVSPGSFVVSGGQATPADLFVNLKNQQVGILGRTDCVVFDEVAGLQVHDPHGTVAILKDYMESGHFSRGGRDYVADASLVLLGNLAIQAGLPSPFYTHLFQTLPDALLDSAVIDRLHAFLPGWEIPKLTPAALEPGWGWAADYLAAILRQLRYHPVDGILARLESQHPLLPHVTQRDRRALEKTASGLIKILYPDGLIPPNEASSLLALAAELRQRIHQQLTEMDPGEFIPRPVGFEGVAGKVPPDFRPSAVRDRYDERLNRQPRVGEITALLVHVDREGTAVEGSVQIIEASVLPGAGDLRLTGFHGQAMEQSARAAFHYLRDHLSDFRLSTEAFRSNTLAVHLVGIARHRDGPSAGLPFLLAMVSALTGRPVMPALAATGEVSLHGEIGPVGGIVAKIRAAARRGRRVVILPEANLDELAQLPPALQEQVELCPVATVIDALRFAFGLSPHP